MKKEESQHPVIVSQKVELRKENLTHIGAHTTADLRRDRAPTVDIDLGDIGASRQRVKVRIETWWGQHRT